jgi:filamentous hemagglutinin family protein
MASFPGGVISGNIIPSAAGQDLGTSGSEWDLVAQNGSFTGTLDVSGTISCVDISASSNYATNGTLSAVGGLTISNGASSVRALSCTTLAASSNATVSGDLSVAGDSNLHLVNCSGIVLTGNESVTGTLGVTGVLTATGGVTGAHNGTVGATTPAAGTFTTLISTGGALNGTVGAATPAAATFTTATANTAVVVNTVSLVSGSASTRNAVRTAFPSVAIGSHYLSTAGKQYIKVANAAADTDWEKVTTAAAD